MTHANKMSEKSENLEHRLSEEPDVEVELGEGMIPMKEMFIFCHDDNKGKQAVDFIHV